MKLAFENVIADPKNSMVSSKVSAPLKYFYPPHPHPPFKGATHDKKHVSPPSPLFLEQKTLFLDLLTSFIKLFKTSDFSKIISDILAW